MKNLLIYIKIIILTIILFSCEKNITTEDPSFITKYAVIELNNNDTIIIPVGTEYIEYGCVATEEGVDVTSKVIISSNVNVNSLGLYSVNYTVFNKDSFPTTKVRTVIVYDPNSLDLNIEGDYTSEVERIAYDDYGKIKKTYYDDLIVSIKKIAPGFYYITDFLGGYYSQGRGYGDKYEMNGLFTLNNDSTINHIYSYVKGWKMSLSSCNGKIFFEENTITISSMFADMIFNVNLTKIVD